MLASDLKGTWGNEQMALYSHCHWNTLLKGSMAAAYSPTVLLRKFSCWPLKEILKDTQFEVLRFHFFQNVEGLNVNKDTESYVNKPRQV